MNPSTNSQPLVTIAIPTVNRLPLLREAVASARGQSYVNLEILVSHDGEAAELKEWVMQQKELDSRVGYQKSSKRLGLAGNWNFCVQSAQGEFLMIIGDDDRLLPQAVEKLMGWRQNMDVVFSNHYLIDETGQRLGEQTRELTERTGRASLSAGPLSQAELAVWRNAIPISSSLLRLSKLKEIGFREDLNTPEIEYYLSLQEKQGAFAFCPEFLAEYRLHAASATSGGLWTHRLASCLLARRTSLAAEPLKRNLLENLLPNAVGRALVAEERELAQILWASSYYPSHYRSSLVGVAQAVALKLPASWAAPVYGFLLRCKQGRFGKVR